MDSSGRVSGSKGGLLIDTSAPYSHQVLLRHEMLVNCTMEVEVRVQVEVCGSEVVMRKEQFKTSIEIVISPKTDNFTIDSLAKSFENEKNTGCLINRYELWSDPELPINKTGKQPWSDLVRVNHTTGQVSVGKATGLQKGLYFNIYFMAISRGFSKNHIKITLNYTYNNPSVVPRFVDPPKDINLIINEYDLPTSPLLYELSPLTNDSLSTNLSLSLASSLFCVSSPVPCISVVNPSRNKYMLQFLPWLIQNSSLFSTSSSTTSIHASLSLHSTSQYSLTTTYKFMIHLTIISKEKPTINREIGYQQPYELKYFQGTVLVRPRSDIYDNRESQEVINEIVARHYQGLPQIVANNQSMPVLLKIVNITSDGKIHIVFNQELVRPPFQDWIEGFRTVKNVTYQGDLEWAINNFGGGLVEKSKENLQTHGRLLEVRLNQLDVTRDILSFDYLLRGDIDEKRMKYDLHITHWDSFGITLQMEFQNPQLVSIGEMLDVASIRVHRRELFVSKQSGLILEQEQASLFDFIPYQYEPSAQELQFDGTTGFLSCCGLACVILQVLLGHPEYLLPLYFSLQLLTYDIGLPHPASSALFLKELQYWIEVEPANFMRPILSQIPFHPLLSDLSFVFSIILLLLIYCFLMVLAHLLIPTRFKHRLPTRVFTVQCLLALLIIGLYVVFNRTAGLVVRWIDPLRKLETERVAMEAAIASGVVLLVSGAVAAATGKWLNEQVRLTAIVFLVRRTMLSAVRMLGCKSGTVIVWIIVNLGATVFILIRAPFKNDHRLKKIELLNECIVQICTYHFVPFLVSLDEIPRETMGYSYTVLVFFLIVAHLLITVKMALTKFPFQMVRERILKLKNKQMPKINNGQATEASSEVGSEKKTQRKAKREPQIILNTPNHLKPRLERSRPGRHYNKKIKINSELLEAKYSEEELEQAVEELNRQIFLELGTFGDIAELSRRQILEGYVREEQVQSQLILEADFKQEFLNSQDEDQIPAQNQYDYQQFDSLQFMPMIDPYAHLIPAISTLPKADQSRLRREQTSSQIQSKKKNQKISKKQLSNPSINYHDQQLTPQLDQNGFMANNFLSPNSPSRAKKLPRGFHQKSMTMEKINSVQDNQDGKGIEKQRVKRPGQRRKRGLRIELDTIPLSKQIVNAPLTAQPNNNELKIWNKQSSDLPQTIEDFKLMIRPHKDSPIYIRDNDRF